MATRVTVAIPVYKRLRHLPGALRAVAAQDHADVDLLVSDNGLNGSVVPAIVREHYPGEFRFRQNGASVGLVTHLNQLLDAAAGEYFVVLCDDDEISPTFVSELAAGLDAHPSAHVALARPQTMNADGGNIRQFDGLWPEALSGEAFVRAWTVKRLRLMSTITLMARTSTVRACGGYAQFPRALFSDNLLLLKLCLAGDVVLGRTAVFRWRLDEASTGFSASPLELAETCRQYISALSTDPALLAYAHAHPATWRQLKPLLREQCFSWYFFRWLGYEARLPRGEWIRAGLQMPFTRAYYLRVLETVVSRAKGQLARRHPALYHAYCSFRGRG